MKTVILAAGMGSRIKSITNGRPKSMLEILKVPLINRMVSGLLRNGITDITLVVGYQYEILIKHLKTNYPKVKFKFILNPEYKNKENIYSLYLALQYVKEEDLLVVNSDLFCEDELIKKAINAPFNTMIVDNAVEYTQEATKVKIDQSGYISDIGKGLSPDQSNGEYIGILKLLKDSTTIYLKQIAKMVKNGVVGIWYPEAFRKILRKIQIKPIYTGKLLWEEIDTESDYERAIQKAKRVQQHTNNNSPK